MKITYQCMGQTRTVDLDKIDRRHWPQKPENATWNEQDPNTMNYIFNYIRGSLESECWEKENEIKQKARQKEMAQLEAKQKLEREQEIIANRKYPEQTYNDFISSRPKEHCAHCHGYLKPLEGCTISWCQAPTKVNRERYYNAVREHIKQREQYIIELETKIAKLRQDKKKAA